MAEHSSIEWTDATWTPIRARNRGTGKVGWFCAHATPGCINCYAESMNRRLGTGIDFKAQNIDQVELFLDETMLTAPLRWRKPRRVFVCSMTDLYADFVPDEWIDRVFAVMALAPQHTFQVLTKRSARMRQYFAGIPEMENLPAARDAMIEGAAQSIYAGRTGEDPSLWLAVHMPLPNVWLGVSAEDQPRADERIPDLLATPAAVRFVSAEPLLGPIDLSRWIAIDWRCSYCRATFSGRWHSHCPGCGGEGGLSGSHPWNGKYWFGRDRGSAVDWIIVGGESGPGARPMHPDWARSLRDQCMAAGVPYFFKQWGEYAPVPLDTADWGNYTDANLKSGRISILRGGQYAGRGYFPADAKTTAQMNRVGKARAGRLLDGVQHDGMPGRP